MFSSFWRRAFKPKNLRPSVSRLRPSRVFLETLEDRLAPAVAGTLSVFNNLLEYTGTAASNVVRISGSGGSLTIMDLSGTITTTVPGFTGSGTNTVTGTIPSSVTALSISGGTGADSVTFLGGFSTTRNVTVNATSIVTAGAVTTDSFAATATAIQLGGTLSTAAGVVAGNANFNGTVTTTAAVTITTASVVNGNVTFNGAVSSFHPLTINAGNTGVVQETGTTTVINGNDFTIQNAGSITLGPTTVNGNVILFAQGGIRLQATLTDNNAADSVFISANQAGAGANGFTQTAGLINAFGPLVFITVGGTANANIQSIMTGVGGTVEILTGGGIPDFNGAALNIITGLGGSAILSAGYAGISLDTQVGNLTAIVTSPSSSAPTPISIRNTGQPLTINAATSTYGNVTLTNNDNVTVAGPITAAGPGGTVLLTTTAGTGAGNVVIDAGQTITALGAFPPSSTVFSPGKVTINTPGSITSTGGSTPAISTPTLTLNASTGISGTTGPLGTSLPIDTDTVSAMTNTGGIALATETANRPLTVTKATANAGAVTISTPTAGIPNGNDLSITGLVTAGAAILLQAGDSLNVGEFATIATSGAITLNAEQNLSVQIGASVAATGNILLNDGLGTFPLGTNPAVIAIAGSVTSAGTITINGSATNSDVISVSGTISATSLIIDVGTGANTLILTPSKVTPYTINLPAGAHSGNTIIINAPASTVATASATGVTFTVASGFKPWTITGFSSADGDTIPGYV